MSSVQSVIGVRRSATILALLAILLSARSSGAAGEGIFIPKARGAGETLDETAVVAQNGATVAGRDGERVTGTINSIANGVLRLSSNCFDREVGVFLSAVKDVRFPSRAAEAGRDVVILTNNDRVYGRILGITPTNTAFESSSVGFLKIGNRYIRQMGFQGSAGILARTDFSSGQLAPLQIPGGNALIAGNFLRISPSRMPCSVSIPVEQSGACTVVINFSRMGQRWSLAAFTDQPGRDPQEMMMNQRGMAFNGILPASEAESIGLTFNSSGFSIQVSKSFGNRQTIASNLPGRAGEGREVRFGYDPASSDVKLWVGGESLSEAKAPAGPKQGKYIVLAFQDACEIRSIEVLDGMAAPAKANAEADEADHTVVLASGESMHAQKLTLADNELVLKTKLLGTLRFPVEKVVSINMSKAGREEPPAAEHPVQVCLAKSVLTVDLIELDAKTAVVRSPSLGELKIERGAIESLRFLAPAPTK